MAADHRNGERFGGGAQALQDRLSGVAGRPDGVYNGDGAAAHGGDVGDVHHDAAPPGEPGIGGDKLIDETFDRQQQVAVSVGDRGAIVADTDGIARGEAQLVRDARDIGLCGDTATGS